MRADPPRTVGAFPASGWVARGAAGCGSAWHSRGAAHLDAALGRAQRQRSDRRAARSLPVPDREASPTPAWATEGRRRATSRLVEARAARNAICLHAAVGRRCGRYQGAWATCGPGRRPRAPRGARVDSRARTPTARFAPCAAGVLARGSGQTRGRRGKGRRAGCSRRQEAAATGPPGARRDRGRHRRRQALSCLRECVPPGGGELLVCDESEAHRRLGVRSHGAAGVHGRPLGCRLPGAVCPAGAEHTGSRQPLPARSGRAHNGRAPVTSPAPPAR